MNRLILIGNGFDLAHGLKTSYADFIDWYWTKRVKGFRGLLSNQSNDDLCSLQIKDKELVWNVLAFNSDLYNKNIDGQAIIEEIKKDTRNFSVKCAPMFYEICQNIESKGWVDIEEIFYKHLTQDDKNLPTKINRELDIIKAYLIEYLTEIQKNIFDKIILQNIKSKISEPIKETDIAIGSMTAFNDWKGMFNNPDEILLLNFNYTSTANIYVSKLDMYSLTHIHIHGNLNNPQSVIFGYGDELDDNFKNLLRKNDNEYLKNVKSIKYLESSNYRKMLEFIESDSYQVYIMGHSCGISDRTLLNTLFEHKNCVSIKPFYHKRNDGSDNYMEIVQNISRNFTDMKLMRDRVVNKTLCKSLLDE
ncbi:MAG: hypothetical protein IKR71_09315 [Bacteroidales bacterium]|nr:hypothetical protein [Bacteroidales bacterium]